MPLMVLRTPYHEQQANTLRDYVGTLVPLGSFVGICSRTFRRRETHDVPICPEIAAFQAMRAWRNW